MLALMIGKLYSLQNHWLLLLLSVIITMFEEYCMGYLVILSWGLLLSFAMLQGSKCKCMNSFITFIVKVKCHAEQRYA